MLGVNQLFAVELHALDLEVGLRGLAPRTFR